MLVAPTASGRQLSEAADDETLLGQRSPMVPVFNEAESVRPVSPVEMKKAAADVAPLARPGASRARTGFPG